MSLNALTILAVESLDVRLRRPSRGCPALATSSAAAGPDRTGGAATITPQPARVGRDGRHLRPHPPRPPRRGREVQAWFDLDEVVFVPTGEPWQKADRDVTPAEHRYLMTVIATASNPRFTVSRVDIDRGGPTYTIDTLRDLHARVPDAELYFITGADALAEIFTWRDADELFELAQFVGCTRPGYEMDADDARRASRPTG